MGKGDKAPSIKLPKQPNLRKSYQQGLNVQLKNLNRMLNREQQARDTYDPKRIEEQQQLQDQFGEKQYQEMLDALNKLDPQFTPARKALGDSVMTDLDAGYGMTPDQEREVEQGVRTAQSSRGNIYGGAAATAESYAKGDRAQALHQERLDNVGKFLSTPSAVEETAKIAPVSPDRSFAYVNPNAGYLGAQFAQQNYTNQLGAAGLQAQSGAGSSTSPWSSILGLVGTAAGAYFGGPVGAQAGGALGSGLGSYIGSDRRLKKDIEKVGKDSRTGLTKYEFSYKRPHPQEPRFEGVMADEVEKKFPAAVARDPNGFKKVNYAALGMKMRRVA
jgi:hypothetical protein